MAVATNEPEAGFDPQESLQGLLRDLRTDLRGLSQREAERRLIVHGPNELRRSREHRWLAELWRQLTHPLALLLWGAAGLAWLAGTPVLAAAIVGVIGLNALFAFAQERQAERAVEALERFLPAEADVVRDGRRRRIEARALVPGDVVVLEEGDRISADVRLIDGNLAVDASALSGESTVVYRTADERATDLPLLEARDLVFSGTTCAAGEARGVVFATGMQTELGRISALSQRVGHDESPLERQVRRVARVIAGVAVAVGLAFLPLGLAAGLPFSDAVVFAVGLLVANVPEGLLPTITLALAVGVRSLARRGAIVKRLSAVETLGSTTVICTDKTGTLTANRMTVADVWAPGGPVGERATAETVAACNDAEIDPQSGERLSGDPTEAALLAFAASHGLDVRGSTRELRRRKHFYFDPTRRLMSTADAAPTGFVLHVKGAPEEILRRSTSVLLADREVTLDARRRTAITSTADALAARGLRVLAAAQRMLPGDAFLEDRDDAEQQLCFLGLVALLDPPRPEVAEAVAQCHAAGIRVIVVTGDNGLTALEVARRIGLDVDDASIVSGAELDEMSEDALDRTLRAGRELVFARSSPEAKLRIADALRAQGEVVAMTGDGVNDAPALRRSDIGVAMGRSGTDVAREAATMILTDDNFATIVAAVEGGRRVFANIRKFVFYIFVHATPEVVPFLVFALSGGLVPLPLTVLQILAIDLGTETLPALALGRDPAEPGIMAQPPRRRGSAVVDRAMLLRAWVWSGVLSAVLVLGAFFFVLLRAGWTPGAETGSGSELHSAYLEATTVTFLAIVVCQVGTAFAARTERASLRAVGLLSNRLLLWGIAFELAFAAAVVYAPPLQRMFATASVDGWTLLLLAPFPVIVWGADELRRAWLRRRRPIGSSG